MTLVSRYKKIISGIGSNTISHYVEAFYPFILYFYAEKLSLDTELGKLFLIQSTAAIISLFSESGIDSFLLVSKLKNFKNYISAMISKLILSLFPLIFLLVYNNLSLLENILILIFTFHVIINPKWIIYNLGYYNYFSIPSIFVRILLLSYIFFNPESLVENLLIFWIFPLIFTSILRLVLIYSKISKDSRKSITINFLIRNAVNTSFNKLSISLVFPILSIYSYDLLSINNYNNIMLAEKFTKLFRGPLKITNEVFASVVDINKKTKLISLFVVSMIFILSSNLIFYLFAENLPLITREVLIYYTPLSLSILTQSVLVLRFFDITEIKNKIHFPLIFSTLVIITLCVFLNISNIVYVLIITQILQILILNLWKKY